MAIKSDFSFYRGEDVTITFVLDPVRDITAWSLTFTILDLPLGTTILSKTVGSGITLSAPTLGTCTITLSSSNTTQTAKGYVWEMKRTDSGSVTILGLGHVQILPRYTS